MVGERSQPKQGKENTSNAMVVVTNTCYIPLCMTAATQFTFLHSLQLVLIQG